MVERMSEERCHCGRPLYYSDPKIRARVERMIELSGGAHYLPITVGGRTWLVQKHYIALHGIRASELPNLGFQEITNMNREIN